MPLNDIHSMSKIFVSTKETFDSNAFNYVESTYEVRIILNEKLIIE